MNSSVEIMSYKLPRLIQIQNEVRVSLQIKYKYHTRSNYFHFKFAPIYATFHGKDDAIKVIKARLH